MKQYGNRVYRDAFFKRMFESQEHKDFALSLYNALNDTKYENPEDIIINSLEDVVYMKVKNDVSFLFNQSMVLFEQQATWNPNMPFRMLDYIVTEWKGMLEDPYDVYLPSPLHLPVPQCIVFYNGPVTKQLDAARIPAAAGTKAVDPGISLRSVHFRFVPGGQIQFVRHEISGSSNGLIGCSVL